MRTRTAAGWTGSENPWMRHLGRRGRAFHQAIYWVGSSLLVLAKAPLLNLDPDQIHALAVWGCLSSCSVASLQRPCRMASAGWQ